MVDRLGGVDVARIWPMASSMLRKPSAARYSRTSSAMYSKKVSTNSGLAGEPGPQLGVLGGDADRTGVEVADPHQMQPRHDERCRGEAELLGAEQRGDDDVAAGLELAVDLHDDPVAQPVEHQGLLGLGQAELPRGAGVLEAGQRAGAGAAVVAGDQHDVGVRLGDAGGDRADADLGDQLDVHAGLRVGVLEVVDQLGEVLDRVDVVVRRRRDQPDARRRVPGARDPRVDLGAGQLAALARLGALRHLDLDVVGVGEVELVTPKRPEATCLIADCGARGPAGARRPRRPRRCWSGPIRFIAMASVSCASMLIEP